MSPADSFAHDAEQSEPFAADRFGGQAQDIPPEPTIAETANPQSEAFSAVISPFGMEQLLEMCVNTTVKIDDGKALIVES